MVRTKSNAARWMLWEIKDEVCCRAVSILQWPSTRLTSLKDLSSATISVLFRRFFTFLREKATCLFLRVFILQGRTRKALEASLRNGCSKFYSAATRFKTHPGVVKTLHRTVAKTLWKFLPHVGTSPVSILRWAEHINTLLVFDGWSNLRLPMRCTDLYQTVQNHAFPTITVLIWDTRALTHYTSTLIQIAKYVLRTKNN